MKSLQILVADHDDESRWTLRAGLQLAGYLVSEAADGRAALEIMRQDPPDMVLLDLRIPVIGSVALLAEMQAAHLRQHPRLAVMGDPEDVALAVEALGLGASDFLEKPVQVKDAQDSIESVLRDLPIDSENAGHWHGDVLEGVRVALQLGKFGMIEPALLGPAPLTDPACQNLAGIVHEAHGRIDSASKFYERAASTDHSYWPARENLQRLNDLRERGETNRPVFFRQPRPMVAGLDPTRGGGPSAYTSWQ
jgi:CheY-like chemotaxis protein